MTTPVRSRSAVLALLVAALLVSSLLLTAGEATDEAKLRADITTLEKAAAAAPDAVQPRETLAALLADLADRHRQRSEDVEAEEALVRAVRVRRELADREPKRADRRRELAAGRAKLSEVQIGLHRWAAAAETCQAALNSAVAGGRDFPGDPGPRADLADAQARRSALLWHMFRRTEAIAAKREECRTRANLADDFPKQAELRAALARAERELGHSLISVGDHPTAGRLLAGAVRTCETLATAEPANRDFQLGLEQARGAYCFYLREAGHWVAAERVVRQLETDRRANKAGRSAGEAGRALAAALRGLALVHQVTGKTWDLGRAYAEALDIETALAADPARPSLRQDEEFLYTNISHEALGRITRLGPPAGKVRQTSQELLDGRRARLARHPRVPGYQFDVATAEIAHGTTVLTEGRLAEAAERAETMMNITRQLAADHPDVPYYRLQVTLGTLSRSGVRFQQGKWDEGDALAREAFAGLDRLAVEFPGDALFLYQACEAQMVACDERHRDLQVGYQRLALTTKARLAAQFPGNTQYRIHMAVGANQLGRALHTDRRDKEAEPFFRHGLGHWEQLAAAHPDVPDFACGAAEDRAGLAAFLWESGRKAEGVRLLTVALADQERVCAAFPDESRFRHSHARALGLRAFVAAQDDELAAGAEFYTRAIGQYERLLKAGPLNTTVRSELVGFLKERGLVYNRLGKVAEYDRDWARAGEVRDEGAKLAREARPTPVP